MTDGSTIEAPVAREPWPIALAERGLVPDFALRAAIRRLCAARLRSERADGIEAIAEREARRLAVLRGGAIALEVDAANRQHYELPPAFFERCLGPRLKYSSALFPTGGETLAEAEELMLATCDERAGLADGQRILELGCGWGSWTLWMAERYPHARITAVSNSSSQRAHIEAQCRARGFANVEVLTCDVNRLERPRAAYDRIVSVEMFEHLRNYAALFDRLAAWLAPDGRLFVHVFCHRELLYPFEDEGRDDWMARHFFTGGTMPSSTTLLVAQDALACERRWLLAGSHYERTANAWLSNQDRNAAEIRTILDSVYGVDGAIWFQRWRVFWMACAELFGYRGGEEWLVAHYRFAKR